MKKGTSEASQDKRREVARGARRTSIIAPSGRSTRKAVVSTPGRPTTTDGLVIWLTGRPCAGKSTIAEHLRATLTGLGGRVQVLDGDAVRPHLSQGLSYSREDRETNILRIAFVASLLAAHGVIVIVAVISPFESTRAEVRRRTPRFFEVHVDCPPAECERRDVKGMYALARSGVIAEFTGVSGPYETPVAPDIRVDTSRMSTEKTVEAILAKLHQDRAI